MAKLEMLKRKAHEDFLVELALTPESQKMDLINGTGKNDAKGDQILKIVKNANAMQDKLTKEFADKLPIIQASVEKNMPEYSPFQNERTDSK